MIVCVRMRLPVATTPWARVLFRPCADQAPAPQPHAAYEAVIRVNSQSGKGGVAYLLRTHAGLDLPPGMRPEFSRIVQEATDVSGREATPKELYELFRAVCLTEGEIGVAAWSTHRDAAGAHRFVCTLTRADGHAGDHEGTGGGPLTAFADALAGAGCAVEVLDVVEQADVDGDVVAYARCRVGDEVLWGAGRDGSALAASVRAVLSAVNRGLG